jgi:hypothetical protein
VRHRGGLDRFQYSFSLACPGFSTHGSTDVVNHFGTESKMAESAATLF